MENKLKQIFSNVLRVDINQINDDLNTDMVNEWDSLGHLNLVVAIQDEFTVELFPDDIEAMFSSFKSIKDVLTTKGITF